MVISVTVIIVMATSVISFIGFSNQNLINELIFYPPAISERKQWYRFFTCGLIHADIAHLAFNMISFYYFGRFVESFFKSYFDAGALLYIVLYVSALAICLLPTYMKQKDNYQYRSLGASGAVSAIVFAGIFLSPLSGIRIFFIPIDIPGFVFGPLYLIISAYLSKRGAGNINHSAHFWGALYGIAFLIATSFALSKYDPVTTFIEQVKSYF